MQGLFKKVNKGVYPRIGKNFSKDLSYFIKIMLQVNPNSRPDCDDLLSMPMIMNRAKKLCPQIYNSQQKNIDMLLKTIYVPKYHKETPKGVSAQPLNQTESDKLDHFVRYI